MKLFILPLTFLLLPVKGFTKALYKIAVVPKTKNLHFYQESYRGCKEFAKKVKDLKCLYDGALNYQDIRSQNKIVAKLAKDGIDGLLIAVNHSKFLIENSIKEIQKKKIPIVTYDSDFNKEHQSARLAYVGTNNFNFGVALGKVAKKYKSKEMQKICIQSGNKETPNLSLRLQGIRHYLSSGKTRRRLNGENGWMEIPRCPLHNQGEPSTALFQLKNMLDTKESMIFLTTAGFAQVSPKYIEQITPYKSRIKKTDFALISADTEPVQLDAIKAGLSLENIGQKPYQMGYLGAQILYNKIKFNKAPKKEVNHINFYQCNKKTLSHCQN